MVVNLYFLPLKNNWDKKGENIKKKDNFLRSNEQIRFSPINVIDEEGNNYGLISNVEALSMARERGLDLVEINPTSRPPICKIMDFGKFKYDQAKKNKEARAKQKIVELKEIRLTAKIGDHDLEYKAKNAKEFFDDGDKVKVSMRLRGRENIFVDNAFLVFEKFAEKAGLDYESKPIKSGNQITAMLTEKKKEVKETKVSIPTKVEAEKSEPEKVKE